MCLFEGLICVLQLEQKQCFCRSCREKMCACDHSIPHKLSLCTIDVTGFRFVGHLVIPTFLTFFLGKEKWIRYRLSLRTEFRFVGHLVLPTFLIFVFWRKKTFLNSCSTQEYS